MQIRRPRVSASGFGCALAMCAGALGLGNLALAQQRQAAPVAPVVVQPGRTALGERVEVDTLDTMHIVLRPSQNGSFVTRGPGCPPTTSSHTDANFGGGSFTAQAGFAQQEIAAASYQLTAGAFPIKIDLMEFILVTSNAIVQTTTQWSVLVWEGNPNTGTLVAEYSSDDIILPHARIGPGTAGLNVQVSVDPGDPEQIYIYNIGGSNTFSIGLRIDDHHQQTGDGCGGSSQIPSNQNAFPCTDVSGLSQGTRNWLRGVNCGIFGCPPNGGWSTFSGLNVLCRPSGDWVMRATWSSVNCTPDPTGSCCISGACSITTNADCTNLGGSWTLGQICSPNPCPSTTGACCFAGGTCQILTPVACSGFGGTFIGLGVACGGGGTCPLGACCMPDGTCIAGVSSPACAGMGGTFQGVGSSCTPNNCPQPTGACCSTTNFCFPLTQADCSGIPGATWQGALTVCDPNPCGAAQTGACCTGSICIIVTQAECTGRFIGSGSACNNPGNDTQPCCRADYNQDTDLGVPDIFAFLTDWFAGAPEANFDLAGTVPEVPDIFAYLTAWFAGCQ